MGIELSDKEMADILKKSLKEVEQLKKDNPSEYKMLRTGAICKKLGLGVDDLLSIYDKKVKAKA